jgi:guanine deaminase
MRKEEEKMEIENHEIYLNEAFSEAFKGVRSNVGGPFGAVVVLDGKIIGKGCNHVLGDNDPTAHAEIIAIRQACKSIANFDLTGAILYSTCEPCPMCLSAIYWANIKTLYFCSTRVQAEEIGFKDNHIYNELNKEISERSIPTLQLQHPLAKELFGEWMMKQDKTAY